jgi:hypothetical protein
MSALVKPISARARLAMDPTLLGRMMAFDHPALKERMVVKIGWTPEFTEDLFGEMKKFLYLCATNEQAMAPPEDIDEIWHNFILFTADYAKFCDTYVGFFLNHQPLTVAERAASDGTIVRNTLAAARAVFGDELPQHWAFTKVPGSCGPGVCGASTNCQ